MGRCACSPRSRWCDRLGGVGVDGDEHGGARTVAVAGGKKRKKRRADLAIPGEVEDVGDVDDVGEEEGHDRRGGGRRAHGGAMDALSDALGHEGGRRIWWLSSPGGGGGRKRGTLGFGWTRRGFYRGGRWRRDGAHALGSRSPWRGEARARRKGGCGWL